ncbi:hypothetical protein Y1Q_0017828 [Alligator mississippiensis]|uniref:Uncharacterized protein n=1 Tax=Alligator mississippiensis TaxID=8496 RepID=A0A151MJN2_ALLMI|nr:hypothetical protein Y1Q_0017828 [Alligator mississippiensis]
MQLQDLWLLPKGIRYLGGPGQSLTDNVKIFTQRTEEPETAKGEKHHSNGVLVSSCCSSNTHKASLSPVLLPSPRCPGSGRGMGFPDDWDKELPTPLPSLQEASLGRHPRANPPGKLVLCPKCAPAACVPGAVQGAVCMY